MDSQTHGTQRTVQVAHKRDHIFIDQVPDDGSSRVSFSLYILYGHATTLLTPAEARSLAAELVAAAGRAEAQTTQPIAA